MAILRMTFRSRELKRDVPVNVVLPFDRGGAKPYPTLYLLHGLQNSCDTWPLNTRIERWASDRGLAVVMPQGENSFWLPVGGPEYPYGDFSAYVTDELVQVTRDEFCLSRERSRTFIGGFSMGGYGALRNGLLHADTFGKIAVFSGAVHFFEVSPEEVAERGNMRGEAAILGDLDRTRESDLNPRWLAARAVERVTAGELPSLPTVKFMVGTEDWLVRSNRSLADGLREMGYDVTYTEAPGKHSFDFVGPHLPEMLDWLMADK